MDVVSVVSKLKDLASDEANRVTIVQDKGCLPGLKLFLSNTDQKVVTIALETLKLLSLEVNNQAVMLKDRDIIISVKNILESTTSSKEQKVLAAEIFKNILPKSKPTTPTPNEKSSLKENNGNSSNTTSNKSSHNGASKANNRNNGEALTRRNTKGRNKRRGSTKWTTSHNRDSYSISLYILNMEEAKRDIEVGLLMVKGVISFTFDMKKDICVVRASKIITPEMLYKGINEQNNSLKPQQVVKGDTGEMNKYIDIISPDFKEEEAMNDDGYVDEDTNEYEKEFNANTLAKLDEDTETSGSWFGGVGNYIAKSLYW